MGEVDLAAEFHGFTRSAWRLCSLDEYDVADDELASITEWTRTGHAPEPDNGWLPILRAAQHRGATIGRVQVLSRPLTRYAQWLLAVYQLNRAAGEDVRIAYRHEDPTRLRDLNVDFWIFDGARVARLLYDHRGRFLAAYDDTCYLDDYQRLRDRAVTAARPIGHAAVA